MGQWKEMSIRKNLLVVPVFLLLIGALDSPSYGEEGHPNWGFSFLGGGTSYGKRDVIQVGFLPRWSLALHKKWDLEFEGNFSYYGIVNDKNFYLLGTNANVIFKPIQWNRGSLFIIGGAGVGYNNGNGRVHDIGNSHFAGLLQIGMGTYIKIAKRWWLRGEYRFQHISDPFYHGDGINTHTFVMGVSF
jgi:hypothetical protein